MRKLVFFGCLVIASAMVAASVGSAQIGVGVLSVEHGRGVVTLDLRGSVLGRLGNGTLRVVDLTPRDRFEPTVVGRKLVAERVGLRTTVYRGQGLRFRMLGGAYRIVVRGSGISLSAAGRGTVQLDAERRFPGDDAGVYSLDGPDCSDDPLVCTPLPDDPERYVLGEGPEPNPSAKLR
jgi:hypothetical protein